MGFLLEHKIRERIVHLDYLFRQEDAAERRSHLQTCDYNMKVQSTLLMREWTAQWEDTILHYEIWQVISEQKNCSNSQTQR